MFVHTIAYDDDKRVTSLKYLPDSRIGSQYYLSPPRPEIEYQPSGEGGTGSPSATPHHLQNPKWPPGGPKWPPGSGKVFTSRFLGVLSNFY